jgi:outer membrane murein-binding lipoprotein Lpp
MMLAAAMLLVGCTQVRQVTGTEDCDDPSLISAQRQLCHQNATFNQTVAGGAVVGALGGAAVGALACGIAGKNPLACAAIGGAAGLFAGGVTGYVVAKKQEAAHENVREIDSVTADLRKQNEDLQSDVIAARQVAAHGQQKLASIKAAVRSGTISADQARVERAKIGQDSEHLANIISHLQEQEKNFQEASQQVGQSSPDYTHQLAEMKRNVRVLEQQKDALDRAMAAG